MKFTAAIAAIIIAATAVSATALPAADARCGYKGQACGKVKARIAEPEARCGYKGQACGKVKRAAEAFADVINFSENLPRDDSLEQKRCDMGSCYEAKMMTREIAAIVAETTEDPAAYYDSLNLEDEETTENLKREAEARCGYKGQACGKAKRDAAPEPVPEARCGYKGQACGKVKREAEADARCGYKGQACGKLKRAAEAIAEAIAEAEPGPRCGYKGQACGKAKRDAFALAHAADLVLGNL